MGQCINSLSKEQINEINRIANPNNLKKIADAIERIEVKEIKTQINSPELSNLQLENPKHLMIKENLPNNNLFWKKESDSTITLFYKNLVFNTKDSVIYVYNYNKTLEKFLDDFKEEIIVFFNKNEMYDDILLIGRHISGAICGIEITNYKIILKNYFIDNIPTVLYCQYNVSKLEYEVFFKKDNGIVVIKFNDDRFKMGQIITDLPNQNCIIKDLTGEFNLGQFKINCYFENSFNEYNYRVIIVHENDKFLSETKWKNQEIFKLRFKHNVSDGGYNFLEIKVDYQSIICLNNFSLSTAEIQPISEIILPPPTAPVINTEESHVCLKETNSNQINNLLPNFNELPSIPLSQEKETDPISLQIETAT